MCGKNKTSDQLVFPPQKQKKKKSQTYNSYSGISRLKMKYFLTLTTTQNNCNKNLHSASACGVIERLVGVPNFGFTMVGLGEDGR